MKQSRGFTLIEMAIVLVIITILIGGLAMPLSAQIQARRIAETRQDMEAIHDALIGYAMSHTTSACTCAYTSDVLDGLPTTTCTASLCSAIFTLTGTATLTLQPRHYLPCPDGNNDGLEDARNASGQCTNKRAGLPWITLGVNGADAWGNRYTYAVDRTYSNDQTGFISTPTGTEAELKIYPNAACTAPVVMQDIPAVVVSHGPKGRGARNMSGGTPLAPASVAADERQNLDTITGSLPCNSTTSFVSRTPTDDFDDLVIWLSKYPLFNRVCPAGGCP